ncbi:hypothetical protein HZH66_004775 [Vespula vulgaris]|uniref:Uncharacterized protein n=1 Tax=Vespula vulgaris TaxID=7454 RepID=A0A834K9F3_VESVU|nr:hypothetical protein HZH66_004775 [Vespula vulgaris]
MTRFCPIHFACGFRNEGATTEATFDREITVISAGYLLKNHKDIDRDNGGMLRPTAPYRYTILSRWNDVSGAYKGAFQVHRYEHFAESLETI